jgi:hypothetical protein
MTAKFSHIEDATHSFNFLYKQTIETTLSSISKFNLFSTDLLNMDVKNRGVSLITFSLFLLLSSIFPHHFSVANQLIHKNNSIPPTSIHSLISSLVYSIKGNVYPDGYVNITNPLFSSSIIVFAI